MWMIVHIHMTHIIVHAYMHANTQMHTYMGPCCQPPRGGPGNTSLTGDVANGSNIDSNKPMTGKWL